MLRVGIARLVGPLADEIAMPDWFGESERGRWAGLKLGARAPFVASRTLLRELLQAATGVPAARWSVSAEAGTPPTASVAGEFASAPPPHASLSHRLGWVAAAVSATAVGVDLECDRPPRSDPAERAALMLAPSELARWHALPANEREDALLTCWTAKEAWFKARRASQSAWDFRRVAARACEPAHANVRTWRAAPLHVAVYCEDAQALAAAECAGLSASASTLFWHVALDVAA